MDKVNSVNSIYNCKHIDRHIKRYKQYVHRYFPTAHLHSYVLENYMHIGHNIRIWIVKYWDNNIDPRHKGEPEWFHFLGFVGGITPIAAWRDAARAARTSIQQQMLKKLEE